MISKLPPHAMDFKRFMLRGQVIQLYRDIFRTLKRIPDEEYRLEMTNWARADFKNNKHHTDEAAIKMMINHGKKSLESMQRSLDLAQS